MYKALFILIITGIFGCGKDEGNAFIIGDPALFGKWHGNLTRVSGSETQEFPVFLELAKAGNFKIDHTKIDQSASGDFSDDTDNRKLTLEFTESTFVGMSLAKTSVVFDYQILNDNGVLSLNSKDMTFALKRSTDQEKPLNLLDGNWRCDDNDSQIKSQIYVEDGAFWMSKTPNNNVTRFYRGKVAFALEQKKDGENTAAFAIKEAVPFAPGEVVEVFYFLKDGKAANPIRLTITEQDNGKKTYFVCRLQQEPQD